MNLLAFDGELAVDAGDDDLVLVVGKAAINHKYIAVIDARTNHRVAAGLGNESRLRTIDQKIVKVRAGHLVILLLEGLNSADFSLFEGCKEEGTHFS